MSNDETIKPINEQKIQISKDDIRRVLKGINWRQPPDDPVIRSVMNYLARRASYGLFSILNDDLEDVIEEKLRLHKTGNLDKG